MRGSRQETEKTERVFGNVTSLCLSFSEEVKGGEVMVVGVRGEGREGNGSVVSISAMVGPSEMDTVPGETFLIVLHLSLIQSFTISCIIVYITHTFSFFPFFQSDFNIQFLYFRSDFNIQFLSFLYFNQHSDFKHTHYLSLSHTPSETTVVGAPAVDDGEEEETEKGSGEVLSLDGVCIQIQFGLTDVCITWTVS